MKKEAAITTLSPAPPFILMASSLVNEGYNVVQGLNVVQIFCLASIFIHYLHVSVPSPITFESGVKGLLP